jgi:hypothetical protein
MSEIVDRLIALHGEKGAVPTRNEWHKILNLPPDAPVVILNLIRFHPDGGRAAYFDYIRNVGPAFARTGGEQIYFGPVAFGFGMTDPGQWDAAILTRYPTPLALAQMWLDPDFIDAHRSREDGLADSQVLVLPEDAPKPRPKNKE